MASGEPALENRQGKPDVDPAPVVAGLDGEALGPVHLVPDVGGDLLVQVGLLGGELVVDRVGVPLREKGLLLEGIRAPL